MKYLCYKRLKEKTLCGDVNIAYGTVLESDGVIIKYKNAPLCYTTSQISIDHFVSNDDGEGKERGKLVSGIKEKLRKDNSKWDKVWEDKTCLKYKKEHPKDHFLWGAEFFKAPIEDLEYILNLL